MNTTTLNSGLEFTLEPNKLNYLKADYPEAVDWQKPFIEGKYAYKNPVTYVETLYFGARYMEKAQDSQLFHQKDFMADLTVINAGKVGDEFVKSVGHYHCYVPGCDCAYPEVYEAVSDGIEYMLQSEPDENGLVSIIWVLTTAGDKIIMPPNWGHVSMNVSDQPVVEIDLQKRDNPNGSDYSMFKERVGGAVYRTNEGLIINPNYKVKSLKVVKPKEVPDWNLIKNVPLYTAFIANPDAFKYLLKPQDFVFEFDKMFEVIEPPFTVFEV